MLPALVFLAVFFLWPAYTAAQISLYDYNIVSPAHFVGLDNFRHMATDQRFWHALRNTGIFLVAVLPLTVVLPLPIALLVNRPLRGINMFRLAYYLPVVTSMVAIAIAWSVLFDQRGVLNWILTSTGVINQPIEYLLDTRTSLFALVLVEGWQQMGYFMVIYLAGLQSLPSDLLEAAQIDGANAWQRFWRIILPLMRPYVSVCLLVSAINSMQAFASVYVLTKGGPQDSSLMLGYYIYDTAFSDFDFGYASAMGIVLSLLLVIFAFASYKINGSGGVDR